MRYTIQACKYVIKNFFYVLPFVILPALFFSVSTDEEAIKCLMETLIAGDFSELHFSHIFQAISILNFSSWKAIGSGIVGIIALVFCVALLMAMLEKHMRIGKRTFNGVFSKLNDNLISTCGYALLLLVIYEIWTLLTSALLFLISRFAVGALAYILCALVYLGMHVVLLYAISVIYLWLPCMQITGFKAAEALYYSNRLANPVKWKILLGQMLFLLCTETTLCLCVLFAPSPVLLTVLTTAFYAALIMVYCVRMQVAYFDLDNIERADLTRYYN